MHDGRRMNRGARLATLLDLRLTGLLRSLKILHSNIQVPEKLQISMANQGICRNIGRAELGVFPVSLKLGCWSLEFFSRCLSHHERYFRLADNLIPHLAHAFGFADLAAHFRKL